MLTYPDIDPIIIHIGPVALHWYGLMYGIGFIGAWWLGRRRARRPDLPLTPNQVEDLLIYVAAGVVLGGRLGYVLFYDLPRTLSDPLSIFKIWEGGMSFHGGLLGVFLTTWFFARRVGCSWFDITDFVAPLVPIGLGAGRIGNFINGELWGKPTDLPWGMVVPRLGPVPHHPSQLYEFALEGVALLTILLIFGRKPRPRMAVSGMFLLCYGTFRFLVEFVRMPDPQLGYLAFGWVTMGQVLSAPMILGGALLMWIAYKRNVYYRAPAAGRDESTQRAERSAR